MSSQPSIRIALVGNPNIGKTTLFNKLCGLNQRTGNYPGVTVDKKKGAANYKGQSLEIVDLPGINSLYPKSKDEELVVKYLLDTKNEEYPHKFVVVVSALNLKRNLYLLDQVKDLNIPIVLAVNMIDLAEKRGIFIDFEALSNHFNVPVLPISAKKSTGIDQLKDQLLESVEVTERAAHYLEEAEKDMLSRFRDIAFDKNDYKVFLRLTQNLDENPQVQQAKDTFIRKEEVNLRKLRKNAAILRYRFVNEGLKKALTIDKSKAVDLTTRADRLLMHPIWGQVTFLLVLLAVFQAIFWLASFPMDWIDIGFGSLAEWSATALPEGYLSQLITEGLIPGIGGVVIFIPQIAILFFLFSLLEESGYMSRIIFLNDRVMQKFGMSGKRGRLGPGRIHHCMRAIGQAEKALEMMCKRGLAREAFGKKIIELGANYDIIANARMEIEMARLLCLKAAYMMDTAGVRAAQPWISKIKVVAPLMAGKVIDEAMQLHGAAGISQDTDLAHMWTHVRTLRFADGPDAVHRRQVARAELKKYSNEKR